MRLVQPFRPLVAATTFASYRSPWWRSLLLCLLLLCSIALYVLLIGAASREANTTPFLNVWAISFLPYFVACIVVLATKPLAGYWPWVELVLIFVGALVMRVLLLPVPPLLSHDVWRYLWDAHIVLHGYSPYVYAPDNPILLSIRDQLLYQEIPFRHVPTLYPPGAQGIYALSYLLAPDNVFFLKGIFVGFDMATCAILALLLVRKGLDPRRVIIYAWCPLPIVEFAVGGHVDAATITFTVLAVLCASSSRRGARALTGFLIGVATLIKIYPILLLLLIVRRREWTLKEPALLLTCFATIILSYLPFYILGHGQVLGFFFAYANENTANSGVVPQVIHWLWRNYLPGWQLTSIVSLQHVVDPVVLGTVSLVVLVLRLREEISMEAGIVLLIGAIFAISSHIFPWYTPALLPWIAVLVEPLWVSRRLNGKGLAVAIAWYFTFTVMYSYYPGDGHGWASYYAFVYDVVLLGLGVAVLTAVRGMRAVSG